MKRHATDHTQSPTVVQIHQGTESDTTVDPVRDTVLADALVCQTANETPQSKPVMDMPVDAERKQEPESSTTDAET